MVKHSVEIKEDVRPLSYFTDLIENILKDIELPYKIETHEDN